MSDWSASRLSPQESRVSVSFGSMGRVDIPQSLFADWGLSSLSPAPPRSFKASSLLPPPALLLPSGGEPPPPLPLALPPPHPLTSRWR